MENPIVYVPLYTLLGVFLLIMIAIGLQMMLKAFRANPVGFVCEAATAIVSTIAFIALVFWKPNVVLPAVLLCATIGPFIAVAIWGLCEEISKRYKADPKDFWLSVLVNTVLSILLIWYAFRIVPSP